MKKNTPISLSNFGEKLTRKSAISELMKDLGDAFSNQQKEYCMLGGGNPAFIPEAHSLFQQEMEHLIESGKFQTMLGAYDGPQGEQAFIEVLCDFLNQQFNWNITEQNIALTNGSQNSFFYLFNSLAGDMPDGTFKKVLFPMSPEYVGYADLGLSDNMFHSFRPTIERLKKQQFKYHIDFDNLIIDDDIAALCLSRPTNPTGNVISNAELKKLKDLADYHRIPLIIDNAYGQPFPNIIHTQADLFWDDNTVLCLSLSKLGLPGARTGIVIAKPEITQAISNISGIVTLAPNSVGASLMSRLIKNQEINRLTKDIVKPYYKEKLSFALSLFEKYFSDLPVLMHKPEGGFFLWLWCQDLPISSNELYHRLKKTKVLAIPGEPFFINIDINWQHTKQCLRLNYSQSNEQVEQGLKIISQELRQLYQ